MLIEIAPGKKDIFSQIQLLTEKGYDIAGIDPKEGILHVVISESQLEELRALGYNPYIIYSDVDRELRQLRFGAFSNNQLDNEKSITGDVLLGAYHTYHEMTNELIQLTDKYPTLAKLDTLGLSNEGRIILGLKISDDVFFEDPEESEVLYIGNHHAREVISVEIPLHFAHYLVENYGSNERVTNIVNTSQIWIIPMMNPDGHVWVEEIDLTWRKNRRDNGDGTFGVDLNRNYGFQWGFDDQGSSYSTSSGNYRGTSPFSEPETQAVKYFIESHKFSICLTYHSWGNLYIYPWNYINQKTLDDEIFENLGIRLSWINNYFYGNGIETLHYYMNGEATDWMYGEQITKPKIFALTVEVGNKEDGFIPDTSRIKPLIAENLETNLLVAEFANNPEQVVPAVAQPTLKSVTTNDSNSILVRWEPVKSPALGGYRLFQYNGNEWYVVVDEDSLKNDINEAVIDLTGVGYFKLNAIDTAFSQHLSYDSDVYGINLKIDELPILIVDGFDRQSGSWVRKSHPFVQTVGNAVLANTHYFESCDNNALLDGTIRIDDYPIVIWILGDESTADSTFNPIEQSLVKNYLQKGGKLFISGSEIGWDLVERGSYEDKVFYSTYFKANFITDDSEILTIEGIKNTIFEGLTFCYGDPCAGAPYDENYPDVISAYGGSKTCLQYSGSNKYAAIQYEGLFGVDTTPGKLIYFAFPFETINKEEHRIEIMHRILNFFDKPTDISINKDQSPLKFLLYQNYPNPFNSQTTIMYILPERIEVNISVYNLIGEKIKILVSKEMVAGTYNVIWDATNDYGIKVSSGVYFYQIRTGKFIKTRKMILLR